MMKLQKVGLVAKSRRCFGTMIAVSAVMLLVQSASAVLLESWENDLDGWILPQVTSNYFVATFSTKFGVTDQTYSLALTGQGTTNANYGQMLRSPSLMSLTTLLGTASNVTLDVFTPAGSFGFFLQFDVDVNNADTGFVSLTGFSYPSTVIGAETTMTFTMPAATRAILAASANPTELIIQIGGGFTSGNQTMYLDNLRVIPVPEPSTVVLLGFGLLSLVCVARHRVS